MPAIYFMGGTNWVSGGEMIIWGGRGGGEKIRWENLWDFLTFGGLVIRLGLKPRTHSLEGCCSIQLSYRTRFFLA